MKRAVIEDWDQFHAFLAAQPLIQWSMEKQHEIAMGLRHDHRKQAGHPPPKNDNADLAAALSSMA
ncbi:MAG: hypothetical protein KJ787_14345 [Gammaproteobacteria bacterium]|nr:hypothetical protein [Gammaproteobacteria bacterium]MBU1647509.1 hypothetical protein [Gammaproteobacteria bacterium]MBU1972958.1 hypothetical protein [Gammaproteobacteria bacterium]